ncbi:phosphoribosyltransferase family protein [Pseudomonas asplenii]|uniref:phosphoribosyltransferase family protein n=1 Tax=Pseudomonas asplenii TaxID=53407 RepID=UPI0023612344|nr:phosphoribosyltransferase family protein [Pseudomonas asplenii]
MLLEEVYRAARVVHSGRALTTVNEFTDQLPALRPEVLIEVAQALIRKMDLGASKIVTEEDKGAPLATAVSLLSGIPMAMARWYPYSLGELNERVVSISSEYFEGQLYLNGINPGDRVVIVDDTLSTGGAVIALIEAVRCGGGEVIDVICAVEKLGCNGVDNVLRATGIRVKTIMKIIVGPDAVRVVG